MSRRGLVSRRAAVVLLAAAAWTAYVWITRLVILSGGDESTGFKVVHAVLAVVSLGFGAAVGWIGWRALRSMRAPSEQEVPGVPVDAPLSATPRR